MIILAAAYGKNYELGRVSGVPLWDLPDEYWRFRESIKGHPIILGRKSFDVIKEPIAESVNIVVTRRKDFSHTGVTIAHSLGEAIERAGAADKIFVIGGGDIFKIAIKIADRIEVSKIEASFPEATTFFPEISPVEWKLISTEYHDKDSRHAFAFTFQVWMRK